MITKVKQMWYMRQMKKWTFPLTEYFKEERTLTNDKTMNAVSLMYEEDGSFWNRRVYKILLNGKPVFEMEEQETSLEDRTHITRFNYGEWVHDIEELYNTHTKLKSIEEKSIHDALFAPLD